MNPATINATTFTLTGPGATVVPGLVAYAAIGNTLTFTPTANLAPSTLFTATITTGAQDLAGTGLAANYVWTFTTGAAVVVDSAGDCFYGACKPGHECSTQSGCERNVQRSHESADNHYGNIQTERAWGSRSSWERSPTMRSTSSPLLLPRCR